MLWRVVVPERNSETWRYFVSFEVKRMRSTGRSRSSSPNVVIENRLSGTRTSGGNVTFFDAGKVEYVFALRNFRTPSSYIALDRGRV